MTLGELEIMATTFVCIGVIFFMLPVIFEHLNRKEFFFRLVLFPGRLSHYMYEKFFRRK